MVVDGDSGIGHGTRRMLQYVQDRGLCRAIVVNKIDHAADLGRLLEDLRSAFGPQVLPGGELPGVGLPSAELDVFTQAKLDGDLGPQILPGALDSVTAAKGGGDDFGPQILPGVFEDGTLDGGPATGAHNLNTRLALLEIRDLFQTHDPFIDLTPNGW